MMPTVILETALVHPHKGLHGRTGRKCHPRKFPLESHTVGIMGIWVHDPIVGSRLLSAGDSFRKVSRSLGWPRQWLYLPSPHCPLK